jgi:hypothetical protein
MLRFELGWKDVASGLAKILFGYFLIVAAVMLLVFMLVFVAFNTVAASNAKGANVVAQANIANMWTLGLGCAVLFLLSLYTYIQILTGKVRCAIHAPERCGARWFIFVCILTIIVGPVMGAIDSVSVSMDASSAKKQKEMQRILQDSGPENADAVVTVLRSQITVTQIASILISMCTSIFFVLFLRSIGSCFAERRLIVLADLYLGFTVMLMGFTIFLIYFAGFNQSTLLILGALILGGLASLAWYVGLLIYTRILILTKLENLRSPLEE